MSISEISGNSAYYPSYGIEEQKPTWPVWDFNTHTNFQIAPGTTTYFYAPTKSLIFNAYSNPLLNVCFSLEKQAISTDLILSMNGCAGASEPWSCSFDLNINGEFVQRFVTLDDWAGAITSITIPKHYFRNGENSLNLRIVEGNGLNNNYPVYYLKNLLLSKDPMPLP